MQEAFCGLYSKCPISGFVELPFYYPLSTAMKFHNYENHKFGGDLLGNKTWFDVNSFDSKIWVKQTQGYLYYLFNPA